MTWTRIPSGHRRVRLTLAIIPICLGILLSGCVVVPVRGPIEKIEGQQPDCQNCVNVDVQPPAVGDEPKQIVEGFLRATSNYQPNYSVAKSFLTTEAVGQWRPEDGVSIFDGTVMANENTVTFEGRLVGSLGPDRSFTAKDEPLNIDFGLVKQDGQWRINSPPPGLLVQQFSFASFYQTYDLFFLGKSSVLVPDPIYLPNLRNEATTASVLIKALLSGPSEWLRPAVRSALPPNTTLSVDSVTIQDGIAEVPLNSAVLSLKDQQRSLMAAQVVYTLRQVGVRGVRFLVDQQPYRVPEGDPQSFDVSVDAISKDLEPVPFNASEQLYAFRDGALQLVMPKADVGDLVPMPGEFGEGKVPVDSLAVSVANTDVAVVTGARTTVKTMPAAGGEVRTLIGGLSEILRPQYTRFGELWAIAERDGKQQVWILLGDRNVRINAPAFVGAQIKSFSISPDGTRIAAIRGSGDQTELGIARINRGDKISVDGWRTLKINRSTTAALTRFADLGWIAATELLVLAGTAEDASLVPYQISQDAFEVRAEGEPNTWEAVALTVLPRNQRVIVLGADGQTYRDEGSQWLPFLDGVSAIAYPG